jgi:hypothetical protein
MKTSPEGLKTFFAGNVGKMALTARASSDSSQYAVEHQGWNS